MLSSLFAGQLLVFFSFKDVVGVLIKESFVNSVNMIHLSVYAYFQVKQ